MSGAARHERGFTLLEMVVVLVLLALASMVMFPSVVSMLRAGTRSAALSASSGDGRIAERLVEHDVRGAAAARSNGSRPDAGTPTSSVIDALNAPSRDLHDVLEATPTRLRIWSEALRSSPGPEIVTWELREDASECSTQTPNWCVVRTVEPSVGATLSEVVTRGRTAFPQGIPNNPCSGATPTKRLFCYRTSTAQSFVWNQNWNDRVCNTTTTSCSTGTPAPTCRIQWASLDSAFGSGGWVTGVQHNGFDPSVQLHQLDLVTGVAVILPSGGGYGMTSERTFNVTEVAIRSRQGDAYQRAIMCGGR